MSVDLTPMMRQYLSVKEQQKDSILFFRLGDFYEMFFDDAKEASRILHIALTAREAGKGNKVPMCGIPFHAADNYIARLIKAGKKVSICEQVEEPSPGKQIVRREIIKIITPGTFMADEILQNAVNNYIAAFCPENGRMGFVYADITTGEFRVTEIGEQEDLFSELYKISPAESLVPESFTREKAFQEIKDAAGTISSKEDWFFDYEVSLKEIKSHFSVQDLSGFGCQDMKLAVRAAGALIKYLKETQKNSLDNFDTLSTYHISQYMVLDWNSHRNLELVHSMEDFSQRGTLLEVLDDTRTPMGKRRLKHYLLNPLLDLKDINDRLDSVQYFVDDGLKRRDIRLFMQEIYDIDRLSNKVSLGGANARDVLALASSLKNIKMVKECLTSPLPDKLAELFADLADFSDIIAWVDKALDENPPITIKEGGIIKTGYDAEVDELKKIISSGKDWLIDLQNNEIKKTGINSLKVGYNRVFGYYIEVTNSNLSSVPADYIRKQTLSNAERFITPELKEYESKIIGAEDRIKSLEYELFVKLRERIANEIERLKRTADAIGELDVLSDLSEIAVRNDYVRPSLDDGKVLRIVGGRHPVLERLLKGKEFVPNDVQIGDDSGKIFIITGSNMAGKSTFIRQVALITIMAQMGSFVPAKEASVGIVDRVFTRVGASDRLYRGMSTFMVEMLETANILNNATPKSLIILDEIGRGTSTYDGVSIAWAVVEYIYKQLSGAKTLFATHFHEITELAQILKGVRNYNLAIREWKDEIIFLYKVVEGSCDESFGIHVAKLAGIPGPVVLRAREILNNLQKDSLVGNMRSRFANSSKNKTEKEPDLFSRSPEEENVIKCIRDIDVNSLTPMEALRKIEEFKKELEA
ncbi:MAG TPA: DNA mismatch repair protein MutS [Candidatus Omnitrophota bacterium]|nr:DNA mismatch repair protein MutS [Candidatus Omnitrophota bacterium]HPS20259.1 DNA mismatch repair protein MutS [Candidatus Omnitrophota bacterium]